MMSDPTPEAAGVLDGGVRQVLITDERCPAVAGNLPDDSGRHVPVRTHGAGTRGRLHHDFTGFLVPALFAAFGLPECL
jgi:hypothetical protein